MSLENLYTILRIIFTKCKFLLISRLGSCLMKISASQCSFYCGFYCKHLAKWIKLSYTQKFLRYEIFVVFADDQSTAEI